MYVTAALSGPHMLTQVGTFSAPAAAPSPLFVIGSQAEEIPGEDVEQPAIMTSGAVALS